MACRAKEEKGNLRSWMQQTKVIIAIITIIGIISIAIIAIVIMNSVIIKSFVTTFTCWG